MKPLVEIGFMPEALSTEPASRTGTTGSLASAYSDIYTGWAYPPKDYAQVGRAGPPVGAALRSSGTAGPRSRAGCGRSGTSRTSATGRARRRSISKLYDYAADGLKRALPTARDRRTARHRPRQRAARAAVPARLSRALPARHELRDRQDRLAARLHRLPRQGRAAGRRRPRPHGHLATSSRHRPTASQIVASFPELKDTPIVIGESDPEGCAACSVAYESAERLSQRDDVLQLHGGDRSPRHLRARRSARGQPARAR